MNINQEWKRFIAVSDSHGDLIDPISRDVALAFAERYKPDIRFHLGDFTNQSAFRSGAAHTIDEAASISQDNIAGLDFLRAYRPTHLLVGNHEARLLKDAHHWNAIRAHAAQCILKDIQTLVDEIDARYLCRYNILDSWIEMGGYKWMHGWMFSENAIRDHAEHFGNCAFGHTHRSGMAHGRRSDRPTAFNTGTLSSIPSHEYAATRRSTAAWNNAFLWGEMTDTQSVIHICERPAVGEWRLPL